MKVSEKSNWINKDIHYLKNVSIREYDIRSGGLSIIKEYKLLPVDIINKLEKLEKTERNISIGKMQSRSSNLAKNIVEGFGKAREEFVKLNNISLENILTIKKDAMFLINCPRINGKINDNIEFRLKHEYSSYIYLNNREFYLNFDGLTTKGLSEDSINYQKNYLLEDIRRFLMQAEKINSEMLFKNLKRYSYEYLTKQRPIETYRNLDSGEFEINSEELGQYNVTDIDESFIEDLDISYNYVHYILPLIREIMISVL